MRAAHEQYAAPTWLDELEPTPPVSQEDNDALRPRRVIENERRATLGPGVAEMRRSMEDEDELEELDEVAGGGVRGVGERRMGCFGGATAAAAAAEASGMEAPVRAAFSSALVTAADDGALAAAAGAAAFVLPATFDMAFPMVNL